MYISIYPIYIYPVFVHVYIKEYRLNRVVGTATTIFGDLQRLLQGNSETSN